MLKNKTKFFLICFAAALLTLAGFLFARYEAEQAKKAKEGKETVLAVDKFANWQTYYGWKKGFEIRIPPEWSKNFDHDGDDSKYADKFWRGQVGRVGFLGFADKTEPSLVILAKDSDLSLDEFATITGFEQAENVNVNGLAARQARKANIGSAIIQDRKRFFYLVFTGRSDKVDGDLAVWEKILSTFAPAPQK